MNPLEWVADFATSGMIVAFNFFTAHPRLSGGLTVLFGGSWLATNVVRGWWPEPGRRPRWARVAVEICGPFAAVIRAGLRRVSGARAEMKAARRPRAWRRR